MDALWLYIKFVASIVFVVWLCFALADRVGRK